MGTLNISLSLQPMNTTFDGTFLRIQKKVNLQKPIS